MAVSKRGLITPKIKALVARPGLVPETHRVALNRPSVSTLSTKKEFVDVCRGYNNRGPLVLYSVPYSLRNNCNSQKPSKAERVERPVVGGAGSDRTSERAMAPTTKAAMEVQEATAKRINTNGDEAEEPDTLGGDEVSVSSMFVETEFRESLSEKEFQGPPAPCDRGERYD